MSRSDSTGKCPDPGVFCGYTREWCEGADNCHVVLEERRNAELEQWRKQALEENAAADALRDEVRRLKARLGAEEWTSPDMGCAGIMRRGKAMRNNDLVDELRMAITTGGALTGHVGLRRVSTLRMGARRLSRSTITRSAGATSSGREAAR